jgi:hypothetical protein
MSMLMAKMPPSADDRVGRVAVLGEPRGDEFVLAA